MALVALVVVVDVVVVVVVVAVVAALVAWFWTNRLAKRSAAISPITKM